MSNPKHANVCFQECSAYAPNYPEHCTPAGCKMKRKMKLEKEIGKVVCAQCEHVFFLGRQPEDEKEPCPFCDAKYKDKWFQLRVYMEGMSVCNTVLNFEELFEQMDRLEKEE